MTEFVDRDELRQRLQEWLDSPRPWKTTRYHQGIADSIAILDAMPTPRCETCRRGDDDQGKDQCRGTLLKEASMCNFWEARL